MSGRVPLWILIAWYDKGVSYSYPATTCSRSACPDVRVCDIELCRTHSTAGWRNGTARGRGICKTGAGNMMSSVFPGKATGYAGIRSPFYIERPICIGAYSSLNDACLCSPGRLACPLYVGAIFKGKGKRRADSNAWADSACGRGSRRPAGVETGESHLCSQDEYREHDSDFHRT